MCVQTPVRTSVHVQIHYTHKYFFANNIYVYKCHVDFFLSQQHAYINKCLHDDRICLRSWGRHFSRRKPRRTLLRMANCRQADQTITTSSLGVTPGSTMWDTGCNPTLEIEWRSGLGMGTSPLTKISIGYTTRNGNLWRWATTSNSTRRPSARPLK